MTSSSGPGGELPLIESIKIMSAYLVIICLFNCNNNNNNNSLMIIALIASCNAWASSSKRRC